MTHEEFEVEAIGIEVSSQPVELYKVLKLANAVSGGGEAKHAIAEGYVIVNGELETRKRCKIYDGDVIAFNEEFYVLLCDTPPAPTEPRLARENKQSHEAAPQSASAPVAKKQPKKNGLSATAANSKGKSQQSEKPAKESDTDTRSRSTSGRRSISF
ncbi:RNA-binding S4 domain-containing protein [Enterovibrio norvegicus]|uniref:RNA-binding S4 domain-containing protein n=1 Tax=Enterovibrio norvegicus TaxID=188144 RepID=UPI000C82CF87|nr:RNA-binding S4 domain-containing protein [Enterovibrio norvegicus]PMI34700.1 hypothetical protein BCU47_05685 [Enterovibrio norvegicus]TKF17634.1 hypothetical protein FCV66_05410 [Enterovibrio norvegicus]TKF37512.1 hypothetical protein FCV83_00125 [Enterovibrio norvegicus]